MAASSGDSYQRLRPQPYRAFTDPARLVGMPSSHEVLLTDPELTAQTFVEAGRD